MDEEERERIKALVEAEIEPLRFEVRRLIAEALEQYCGPGRLSPEVVAPFLGVSYRTIYRWFSVGRISKLYAPQDREVDAILAFIERVEELRSAWTEVLIGWRPDSNPDVKRTFYHPKLIAIIEGNMSLEDKAEELMKFSLKLLSREMRSGEE
jgi:hypothetical protein